MTADPGYRPVPETRSDPPPVGSDRPIGEVFSAVTADLSTLIRQEVALAKAEIRQSATQAGARCLSMRSRCLRHVNPVARRWLQGKP